MFQLQGCMALAIGAGGVGGYYLGKWYATKQEAYKAYVDDCQKRNIPPLDYNSWQRTQ